MMKKLNTILLVDDDEITNFSNKFLLNKSEVAEKIDVVMNGEEALKYLSDPAHDDVDLILLDVNMPVMNGFEFLAEFENLPSRRQSQCLILMLTTSLHPDDKQKAAAFKEKNILSGYFNKPLTMESVKLIRSQYFPEDD